MLCLKGQHNNRPQTIGGNLQEGSSNSVAEDAAADPPI